MKTRVDTAMAGASQRAVPPRRAAGASSSRRCTREVMSPPSTSALIGSPIGVTGGVRRATLTSAAASAHRARSPSPAPRSAACSDADGPPPLERPRDARGGEQVGRGAHREPLQVVEGAPVPELVSDRRAQLLVGQRVEDRLRDQQARAQHADQRHDRSIRVDRERRHGDSGEGEWPRRPHPVGRPSRRAPPRRHAAHDRRADDGRRRDGQRGQRDVEALDELPRLVAPVRRQKHDDDEKRRHQGRRQPQRQTECPVTGTRYRCRSRCLARRQRSRRRSPLATLSRTNQASASVVPCSRKGSVVIGSSRDRRRAAFRESDVRARRAARGRDPTPHPPATTGAAAARRRAAAAGSGPARSPPRLPADRAWRRRVDERAADLPPRQQSLLEQPIHRRHHGRVGDRRTEALARFADVDFTGLPDDVHDLTLEHAEAALENLARRLESPEEERRLHHR